MQACQIGLVHKLGTMIVSRIPLPGPFALGLMLLVSVDSDDIKNVDLTKIHNLSGPIAVEGAEPGDCLVVDILDGKCAYLLSSFRSSRLFSVLITN